MDRTTSHVIMTESAAPPPPPQISQLQQFALLLVFVLACGASSGGVTGEATTRARCVHLLPHWQVMRRMLAVAMVNKQRGEEEFF